MKKNVVILAGLVTLLWSLSALAQPAPAPALEPSADVHNALRQLKSRLVDAMNKGDIEAMLAELHPDVVVTWQNAEVSHGRDGVRAYLQRMMKDPNHVVQGYHAEIDVDDLTKLYGDTGIAYGKSVEQFQLKGGMNFTLNGRWSATIVRENGKWMLASIHASSNLFDNPLVAAAKKTLYVGVAVSFVVALLLGWFIGRRSSRARA
jgi:uncharacterized protein (TIGR02246 family)